MSNAGAAALVKIHKLAAEIDTVEDARLFYEIYKQLYNRISFMNRPQVNVGDKVTFDAKRRGRITGILIAKNRKTFKIVAEPDALGRRVIWTVTPNLVKAA